MGKTQRAFVVFIIIIILILAPNQFVYAAILQAEVEANLNATLHGNPQGTLQDVVEGDLQTNLQDYQNQLKLLKQTVDEQTQQKTAASEHAQSLQDKINQTGQTISLQKQSFEWRLENQLIWLFGSKFVTHLAPIFNLNQTIQSEQQLEGSLNSDLQKQNDLIIHLSKEEQQTIDAQNQTQEDIDSTKRFIAGQTREKARLFAQEKSDQAMGKITVPIKLNVTVEQLLIFSKTFLGSPYVWGGSTPTPGFDCSGYVQYIYNHFGINLNRVTWDQYQEGQGVAESDLKPGDLIFFTTYAPGASHVGIYVGNRLMIDDSDYGIAYDSLDHPYWSARYLGARRVIN